MTLYIDSSNNLKTIIKLDDHEFIKDYQSPRDQDVLGAIQQALQSQNKSLTDIQSIQVHTGPGSFTGLRVGISIANTLSFALNIPINSKPPGTTILPNYQQAPSITLSHKNKSS